MKVVRLNEKDIEKLVTKIIKESELPRGGFVYSDKAEIADEVINRIGQYGEEYVKALEELNSKFPSTKYKKLERPEVAEIPKGVKVRSTVYPNR